MNSTRPIGVFDSGFGGLTVLRDILKALPEYDYLYLGDNIRAPYGNRSFDTVYHYTLHCVKWFFEQGAPLVILACNTASAKALVNIQKLDLPALAPDKRVLGVIRPSSEVIGHYSKTGHVGILGTTGTVNSGSYLIEIKKRFPHLKVFQQACPLWTPLIENDEYLYEGSDYFVKKYVNQLMDQCADIDTILLACTHYPILLDKINKYLPPHVKVIQQGPIVADALTAYLPRHPELESQLTKKGTCKFFTTDPQINFDDHASLFLGQQVISQHTHVEMD